MLARTCLPLATAVVVTLTGWTSTPAGATGKLDTTRDISRIYYDGITDDLLTGGLGSTGLANPVAPTFADPLNPTAAELRRLAIYNNYRALVPEAPGGGYGLLFGPSINANGEPSGDEGLIPGTEYTGFGRDRVVYMVQIPDSFDPDLACIVTAPSSGSRGIYGAIGTSGEWGLKRGCAVAYTDKGTGVGAHNLQNNTVYLVDGTRADADEAGRASHFTARISDERRDRFNEATPYRFAFKHAHSRRNPEAKWGLYVLRSIEFALKVLNDHYADDENGRHGNRSSARFTPHNTLVIASSISNGGGASLLAAERDRRGLIDGVAVSEPNVNPRKGRFVIAHEGRRVVANHSKSLYDYTTYLHLYQGCASAAPDNVTAPFNFAPVADACTSLYELGLLNATDPIDQAKEAQMRINDYGFIQEQNRLQPSHWWANIPQAVSVTYANAYSRSRVTGNLCGYSFAATDTNGFPVPVLDLVERPLFATSNGIPPGGGINLVNNASVGGAIENSISVSSSTMRADYNIDGSLCLRQLIAPAKRNGPHTGKRFPREHRIVRHSIRRVQATGRLRGLPAVIVTGRADAILPVNHTSRPYYALSQIRDGKRTNLRYYEIKNAHHLDAFNDFPGFAEHYIPLHHYLFEALDLMYEHLVNGRQLPPSQIVRTVPRGLDSSGVANPIEQTNVPGFSANPPDADLIRFDGNTLFIPD